LGIVVYRFATGLKPDFVAARRLPVEFETQHLQFACDFPVSESRQPTHLRCYHDGVVAPLTRSRKIWGSIAIAPCLNEFSRNVASDVKCLGHSAALSHQSWKFI